LVLQALPALQVLTVPQARKVRRAAMDQTVLQVELAPKVKSALKAQRAGMELMGRQAHKAQPALMRCQPMQVILPAWVQMD
jgi:hypothetical protein